MFKPVDERDRYYKKVKPIIDEIIKEKIDYIYNRNMAYLCRTIAGSFMVIAILYAIKLMGVI